MSAMIDLSTVAAPAVVEPLDFEAVLAQLKAKLLEHLPELASVLELESEPLVKLMQLMAYREVLLRQRINEAARALLLAYAVGTDLEQLGANYGITRLPGETDERLRARVQAAYNRLAAAGPAQAYRQHALAVSADIRDVDVFSEAPGRVTVSVLACQLVPETEATAADAAAGLALFFLNWWMLSLPLPVEANVAFYAASMAAGYVCLLMAGTWMSRLLRTNLMDDVFNVENESFMQETRLIENEYSVNLPTRFHYNRKWHDG